MSESAVKSSEGAPRTHLHAVCENKSCPASGDVTHKDVVCSGSPVCGVDDNAEWHDPYAECPGGHGCGCS